MKENEPPRELPKPLEVNFENIPQSLKERPAWVVWRYQQVEEDLKKPPFSPLTGRLASVSDPKSWGSFEDAKRAFESGKYAGVGLMLTGGIVGIDIDHCIENGQYNVTATTIMKTLNTYTEVSPSGKGVRMFLEGKLPGPYRRRGPVELYQDHRYLTVTGHHIEGTPLEIMSHQPELENIYSRLFAPIADAINVNRKKERVASVHKPSVGDINVTNKKEKVVFEHLPLSDIEILEKAYNAKNGYTFRRYYEGDTSLWEGAGAKHTSQSEADFTLCLMLLYWTRDTNQTDRLFRRSGLMRAKWMRRTGNTTYGERTLREAERKQKFR